LDVNLLYFEKESKSKLKQKKADFGKVNGRKNEPSLFEETEEVRRE